MKNLVKYASVALMILGTCSLATAQEKDNSGKNPDSVRPIDDSNIMWKRRLWRRMDLNEKQNQPFFSKNNEITKYLIEWVQSGVLQPYKDDSLKRKLSKEEFMKNLEIDEDFNDGALSAEEKAAGFGNESTATSGGGTDDGWGDPKPKAGDNKVAGSKPAPVVATSGNYRFPRELTILEIKEDAVFDKQRSRLYFDIQAITIIIPASKTAAGFDKTVASFRYKDLDKLFRSNPNCIYYNTQNEAQHKNMADAFDLRLFSARPIKFGNPEDKDLVQMYGGDKKGLVMSQQLEYKLMEMEHNLWEY